MELRAGPQFVAGYRASGVDLMGHLKDVLERGLKNFTIAQIREREAEVFRWIQGGMGPTSQGRNNHNP